MSLPLNYIQLHCSMFRIRIENIGTFINRMFKNGNSKAKQKVWLWVSNRAIFRCQLFCKKLKAKHSKNLKIKYKVPFCLRVSVSIYVSVNYYWTYSVFSIQLFFFTWFVSHIMRFSTWNSSDCPSSKYLGRNTIRAKFNFCLFPYTRYSWLVFFYGFHADRDRFAWWCKHSVSQNVSWNFFFSPISNKLIAFVSNSNWRTFFNWKWQNAGVGCTTTIQ